MKSLGHVWLFATPGTRAYHAPPSIHGIFQARILEWVAIYLSINVFTAAFPLDENLHRIPLYRACKYSVEISPGDLKRCVLSSVTIAVSVVLVRNLRGKNECTFWNQWIGKFLGFFISKMTEPIFWNENCNCKGRKFTTPKYISDMRIIKQSRPKKLRYLWLYSSLPKRI